jgi:hypothetical protein
MATLVYLRCTVALAQAVPPATPPIHHQTRGRPRRFDSLIMVATPNGAGSPQVAKQHLWTGYVHAWLVQYTAPSLSSVLGPRSPQHILHHICSQPLRWPPVHRSSNRLAVAILRGSVVHVVTKKCCTCVWAKPEMWPDLHRFLRCNWFTPIGLPGKLDYTLL